MENLANPCIRLHWGSGSGEECISKRLHFGRFGYIDHLRCRRDVGCGIGKLAERLVRRGGSAEAGAGDLGFQIWDFRFGISDLGFQIWDFRFQIWDLRRGGGDLRLRVSAGRESRTERIQMADFIADLSVGAGDAP
jgi:hypothetical protein